MAFERDDPRIVCLPESEIMKSTGNCDVMRGRWFAVDPEKGLLFWQDRRSRWGKLRGARPQCNGEKSIAERVIGQNFPWAEIKFFETVIAPVDRDDY